MQIVYSLEDLLTSISKLKKSQKPKKQQNGQNILAMV